MEKKKNAEIKVRKGIKVAADEAESLDPKQIAVLLPDAPPQRRWRLKPSVPRSSALTTANPGDVIPTRFPVNITGVLIVALCSEPDFSARGARSLTHHTHGTGDFVLIKIKPEGGCAASDKRQLRRFSHQVAV
jgi:hypothetical protein